MDAYMCDGGVVVDDQPDGSCVPWFHNVPLWVVCLILFLRLKE